MPAVELHGALSHDRDCKTTVTGAANGSAKAPVSPSSATAAAWAILASIQRPPCTRTFATTPSKFFCRRCLYRSSLPIDRMILCDVCFGSKADFGKTRPLLLLSTPKQTWIGQCHWRSLCGHASNGDQRFLTPVTSAYSMDTLVLLPEVAALCLVPHAKTLHRQYVRGFVVPNHTRSRPTDSWGTAGANSANTAPEKATPSAASYSNWLALLRV